MKKLSILLTFILILLGSVSAQKIKVSPNYQEYYCTEESWYPDTVQLVKSFSIKLKSGKVNFSTDNLTNWSMNGALVGQVSLKKNDTTGIWWEFKNEENQWVVEISKSPDNTNDPRESFILTASDSLVMINIEPDANSQWILIWPDENKWEPKPLATAKSNLKYNPPKKKWDNSPDWQFDLKKNSFTDEQIIGFVFAAVNAMNVRYMEDLIPKHAD